MEHETQKLKELDEEHSVELKEWREKLRPRKKVRGSERLNPSGTSGFQPQTQGLFQNIKADAAGNTFSTNTQYLIAF